MTLEPRDDREDRLEDALARRTCGADDVEDHFPNDRGLFPVCRVEREQRDQVERQVVHVSLPGALLFDRNAATRPGRIEQQTPKPRDLVWVVTAPEPFVQRAGAVVRVLYCVFDRPSELRELLGVLGRLDVESDDARA